METFQTKQEVDTLRSEHLTGGEKPIRASIEGYNAVTVDAFLESNKHLIEEAEENENIDNVNYALGVDVGEGYLTGGPGKYSISPVDTKEKVSTGFLMCTGVVTVGKDKISGENISFLSHQYPDAFLPGKPEHEQFVKDIETKLLEIKERSVAGSVDSVVVGGTYFVGNDWYETEYYDSINLIKNEVSKVLGFEPVIISGPKLPSSDGNLPEMVLFNTKNRTLFISRPEVGNATTQSYAPKDFLENQYQWKSEFKENEKKEKTKKTSKSFLSQWFT